MGLAKSIMMGLTKSYVMKPVKGFMVEERAAKVISRTKPIPAPSYPSTEKQIDMAKKVNPNFMEEHYKKDSILNERLKQVFVSSNVQIEGEDSEKILPQNRNDRRDFEFGFWEPDKASEGKCLLKDALKFMSDYHTDPANNTAEKIASQYKLDVKDVENILEHYRVFQVFIPPDDRYKEEGLTIANTKKGVEKMFRDLDNLN